MLEKERSPIPLLTIPISIRNPTVSLLPIQKTFLKSQTLFSPRKIKLTPLTFLPMLLKSCQNSILAILQDGPILVTIFVFYTIRTIL